MTTLERDLAHSIEETLGAAAQRNEVRVAWVRAMNLTIVTAIGLVLMQHETLWLAAVWAACAWMIVLVERQKRYRNWVYRVTTAIDAVMVATMTLTVHGSEALALATTALVCTLLAVTGALRMNPGWVRVTTALAMLNMALSSWRNGLAFAEGLMLCLLIAGAGVLGSWLARIARRAYESEVHRVVAGRFLPAKVLDAGYRAPLNELTDAQACDATILISDIRSFTTLAETLPPAAALEFLNVVQGTFAAIVETHGGSVDKFMGDGMLAVFGVPRAAHDHASRAIAAATDIAAAAGNMAVRIGIGVHSGRVVAGVLGSGTRLEFTVIGDTVNIAARLESLTKEKQVTALISESVVDRASESGRSLRRLGPARLRGRVEEVVLYTLAA